MMGLISHRSEKLRVSSMVKFTEQVRSLKNAGMPLICLSAEDSDFSVPMHIKAQTIEAIHEGCSKYSPLRGLPELVETIAEVCRKSKSVTYTDREILVTNGSHQALLQALYCLLDKGDEVILQAPYAPAYADMVSLMSGKPVVVQSALEDGFRMSAEVLEQHITPQTRCVIFNSPANPSGQTISKALYASYAQVLRKHPQIVVICDDAYELLHWDPTMTHWLQVASDMQDRTLLVSGLSQAFAMSGWRLGFAMGPEALIEKMMCYQSYSTSHVCNIAQYAGLQALTGDRSCVTEMLTAYRQRHDLIYQMLESMPGVEVIPSLGSFYLFPRVQGLIEHLGLSDDVMLCHFFLEKAQVAIMPGSEFGMPGHVRLSCAQRQDRIEEAMRRLSELLKL